ncbi:unnamed protein product [Cuscuta europaea]|uniref:VQ domain-containing protein n=1 Tax=Cuscuta europaea TaxID=41803 RepID=A0A9P0Z8V7_CUSEU|nr:unnamed protein product [Cuscuta europaea]
MDNCGGKSLQQQRWQSSSSGGAGDEFDYYSFAAEECVHSPAFSHHHRPSATAALSELFQHRHPISILPSFNNQSSTTKQQQQQLRNPAPRKRSRSAAAPSPTTVLTTDTTNFRSMVHQFTGFPYAAANTLPRSSYLTTTFLPPDVISSPLLHMSAGVSSYIDDFGSPLLPNNNGIGKYNFSAALRSGFHDYYWMPPEISSRFDSMYDTIIMDAPN